MAAAQEVLLFNSESQRKEVFRPLRPGRVGFYTCGPTVYRYAHIGNFRTYLASDFWIRAFRHFGYEVEHCQNITDVGHLQDDTSDRGEDKVLAAARSEGSDPASIAAFYTEAFRADARLLDLLPPDHTPRATEFVPAMIAIAQRLEELGLTYQVDGNLYFDVSRSPGYPRLSGNTLESLRSGRLDVDLRKRHPADFLLWRQAGEARAQTWDSPWGRGFPGWHLECSAMSLHYFPDGLDVHLGGADLAFPHHADEIAQSEPVFGGRFVSYWLHAEHLLTAGRKMAKSAGNVLRVADLARDHDPLAFRYLCLSTRYRSKLRFTEDALGAAARGLDGIRRRAGELEAAAPVVSSEARALDGAFAAALADDLDLPRVPPLLRDLLRAGIPGGEKRALLERWDEVLAVGLTRPPAGDAEVADEDADPAVVELLARRQAARERRDFAEADRLRDEIAERGYAVVDTPEGARLRPSS